MNPHALVTGVSSGIGAATASLLLERDFEVFGSSRTPGPWGTDSTSIHWVEMDVTSDSSVDDAVSTVLATAPQLDALVCCAGDGIFGSVEEVSIERARAQFETNFFGTLRTLRAVLPHMRSRGSGRIVVVGSLARLAPIPFQAHYSASKSALDGLVLALHAELRPYGVGISLVEPGDIRTSFNDNAWFGDTSASVYGDRIASCERVVRESLPKAPGPEGVAATIHRALTARRPRVHYYVGPNSRSLPWARRLLPDWLTLSMIRSHFDI
ncbi:SDR family NAD(P)-dependent oxidoreductase [Myxococcota bacterium]|nr:SDR family NAD(P)-dependent oxidoreductase [Myxococcota bacterium]